MILATAPSTPLPPMRTIIPIRDSYRNAKKNEVASCEVYNLVRMHNDIHEILELDSLELTHLSIVELKSTALNHSAKLADSAVVLPE